MPMLARRILNLKYRPKSIAAYAKRKIATQFPERKKIARTRNNDKELRNYSLIQDLTQVHRRIARPDLRVLVIADEFSSSVLSYEWNQVQPTPENYQQVLDDGAYDLFFVESAWEGNAGAWRYHLVGESAPRASIRNFVKACQERGIPTAFWNKEDPPHFEDFLATAELFDYVFTTESAKIPEYIERLKHNRVFELGFAVQPAVHNPAKLPGVERTKNVVFGGMYFRHKYPERRQQMDYLLPVAGKFGLDVYSRHSKDERYQFPKGLKKHIVGTLPYAQMVAAYHRYKVVLNVNSVAASGSMLARRVFEAVACGAAVVSPSTPAIERYFANTGGVVQVSDAISSENQIRALLRSELYRERQVHKSQRLLWEGHTYADRVDHICDALGLSKRNRSGKITIIISTVRPENIDYVIKNVARQTVKNLELVLVTHGFKLSGDARGRIEQLTSIEALKVIHAPASDSLGKNLNLAVEAASGDFIVRMDDDDWYGPNYVRDLRNAANFSGADLVGKAASYIYFEHQNATILTYGSCEHAYTNFVRGATFAGPKKTFQKYRFPEQSRSEDSAMLKAIRKGGGVIYAADRFNFVVNRHVDKTRHTWLASDAELFASGVMEFIGDAHEQLAI